jgi:hypothetical protein
MTRFSMSSRLARPALAVVSIAVALALAPAVLAAGYSVTELLGQRGEAHINEPGQQVTYTATVGDPRNVANFKVGGMSYDAYANVSADIPANVRGRLELIDATGNVFAWREESASISPGAASPLHLQVIANLAGPATSVRVTYEGLSGGAIVLRDAAVQRTLSQHTAIGTDFDSDD